MKVWCILYCERDQRKDITWQLYYICATEEKAKERFKEIKEEEHDKKIQNRRLECKIIRSYGRVV